MTRFILATLVFSGLAFCLPTGPTRADSVPPGRPLPRGTGDFRLGWGFSQVDSALAARRAEVISRGQDFITAGGESPDIEYVLYSFVPMPQSAALLWKVTVAYRVPYGRDDFEAIRNELAEDLGAPADEHAPDVEAGEAEERITWVDSRTAVQLGARWTEPQHDRVDRMLVTWTDRRLQKVVEIKRRAQPGGRRK
jgi:hypothetical protein